MSKKIQKYSILTSILVVGILISTYTPAVAHRVERGEYRGERVQLLVDRARITLNEFLSDPDYAWLHENLGDARGVLIFPQVIKGGFIFGGSGGTGVFLARDPRTGNWSEPAFYSIGSMTFGFQAGGESAQVIMLAMTRRAVESLMSSSFKLGGDASVALGPIGGGAQASADIPRVNADFVSFAKSKGLYAGLNLQGSVIAVRDSLNLAYYGKQVRPSDIIVGHTVSNSGANKLRAMLRRAD